MNPMQSKRKSFPVIVVFGLSLACATRSIGDLGDALTKEAEKDDAASDDVRCWCKSLDEVLATRGRESESQLRYLDSQKTARHFDNVGLHHELAGHKAEVASHQQSLDTGAAIEGKSKAAYEEEIAFHEKALESIDSASNKIPEGSGGEVRGALRGLSETFTAKMEAAKKEEQNRNEGVLDAKAEMLRLANEAAATKEQRLSEGEAAVAQASEQIGLYTAQREADGALGEAREALCSSSSQSTAARQEKRQQAQIAISEANVEKAHAAQMKSYSKLALVGAVGSADRVRTGSEELSALLAKSGDIEGKLLQVLNSIVMDAHLAETNSQITSTVKSSVAALGVEAKANLQQLPSLFDGVRSAGHSCVKADQELLVTLTSAK